MKIIGSVVALWLGTACGDSVRATPLSYASRVKLADVGRSREPDYGALSALVAPAFHTLHDQAVAIVESPALKVYLDDVDALLASPGVDPISGRRFLAIYSGRDRSYEIAPICYHLETGGGDETAVTSVSAARAGCNPGLQAAADITLRSVTYLRAQSKIVEEVACAINTLAHEWAHAITRTDPHLGHRMVFEDDRHDRQSGPVASYTVGAFAQCLYLASANGGVDQFNVRDCVEDVGTNRFAASTCAGGWAAQFIERPRT